jgi:hypothetical protein
MFTLVLAWLLLRFLFSGELTVYRTTIDNAAWCFASSHNGSSTNAARSRIHVRFVTALAKARATVIISGSVQANLEFA